MLVRVLTGHEKRNLDFEALIPGMEVSFWENEVEVLVLQRDGMWVHRFLHIPPEIYDPRKIKTGHFYSVEEKAIEDIYIITKFDDIYNDTDNLRSALLSLVSAGKSSLNNERPILTLKYFDTIVDILRAPDDDFEI